MVTTPDSKDRIIATANLERVQEDLFEFKKEFRDFVKSDHQIHKEINDSCRSTGTTLASYTLAGKLVWAIVGFVALTLGSLMGWEVSRVNNLYNEVSELKTLVVSSTEIDKALHQGVVQLQTEVRELRRQLSRKE